MPDFRLASNAVKALGQTRNLAAGSQSGIEKAIEEAEQEKLGQFFQEESALPAAEAPDERVALDREDPEKTKNTLGDYTGDVLRSPFAALGGLAESLYDLADWATGDDFMSDWDRKQGGWTSNLFGKSKTVPGGLLEGILQFATVFIPGMGIAGGVGKASSAAVQGATKAKAITAAAQAAKNPWITATGTKADFMRKAIDKALKGKRTLTAKEMKELRTWKDKAKDFAKISSVGAVSDLIAFKGQEYRLSNLLVNWQGADANPFLEWMAYDPAQPEERHTEFEGRVKNMIEGFFIGSAFMGGAAAAKGIFKTLRGHREKKILDAEDIAAGREPNEVENVATVLRDPDNIPTTNERNAMDNASMARRKEQKYNSAPEEAKKDLEQEDFDHILKDADEVRPKTPGLNAFKREQDAKGALKKMGEDPEDFVFEKKDGGIVPRRKTADEAAEPAALPDIDPGNATEAQLNAWLKAKGITSTFLDTDLKKAYISAMLKGGKEESLIVRLRAGVRQIMGKDPERFKNVGAQAAYSGARVARSRTELHAVLTHTADEVSKHGRFKTNSFDEMAAETDELMKLGSEMAGAGRNKIDLSRFEGDAEALRKVRVNATVLYNTMLDTTMFVKEAAEAADAAMTKNFVEVGEGAERVVLNQEQALTNFYSAMDTFLAVKEVWADFGTQMSLNLLQRQYLYSGKTALGRHTTRNRRRIGFDMPSEYSLKSDIDSLSELRRTGVGLKGGKTDKRVIKSVRMALVDADIRDAVSLTKAATALSRTAPSEKHLMGMVQEWYLNALLGSPVTWTVNMTSNFMVMALGHFKLTSGALMTGNKDLLKANMRAMFDVSSFVEALRWSKKSLMSGESRSVSGHTAYHDGRIDLAGEITAKNARMKNLEGPLASAFDWLGKAIRHPQRIMLAGDEFFKQWNYRSHAKTLLAMEGYEKGLKTPRELAEFVEEGFEGLITSEGRFRNEGNVYKEARESAMAENVHFKDADDHIGEYMQKHYRDHDLTLENGTIYTANDAYRRQELVDSSTQWALVNTFTNNPTNPIVQNLSNLATFSPWLTFVIPFVRTPANILTFALSHSWPAARLTRIQKAGVAGSLYRKKGDIKASPETKALYKQDELSEQARELFKEGDTPAADAMAKKYEELLRRGNSAQAAEYLGRLSFTGLAVSGIFMHVEAIKDKITGSAPKNPGDRAVWESTGRQPYSIQIGDKWVSYQRMDPFATMLGLFVDVMHGFEQARLQEEGILGGPEDVEANADVIKKVMGIVGLSLANNITKRSYVEGLGGLFDTLRKPNEAGPGLLGNIIGGFVPNALNVSQNMTEEEPEILEARKLLDKFMKKLPEGMRPERKDNMLVSSKLMPRRNYLGEAARKHNLGGMAGLNPFFSRNISTDPVDIEMTSLMQGHSNMSPIISVEGSSLNLREYRDGHGDTAFDRLQELSSKSPDGSVTLRKALRLMIESSGYQSLPEVTDMNLGPENPRNKEIQKIIGKFRGNAKAQILREFPDLYRDYMRLLNKR